MRIFISAGMILITSSVVFGQPIGVTPELLRAHDVQVITAVFDMVSDDERFDGLVAKRYEFDEWGRCVRKKFLYPFYDVVTTSSEYVLRYDAEGRLLEEMRIHATEPLTDRDKDYIGIFGSRCDTSIQRFAYSQDGRLLREVTYKPGTLDTTVVEYVYMDGKLVRSRHFSSLQVGSLDKRNYTNTYAYDSLGRLIREDKTLETLQVPSTTAYMYWGDSKKVLQKKITCEVRWIRTYRDGKMEVQVEQDSLNGRMLVNTYNEQGLLTKETWFRSLDDLETNFEGSEYTYLDGRLIEKQAFNHSTSVIHLTDKIRYEYDENGFLVAERMIYDNELRYSYQYRYE